MGNFLVVQVLMLLIGNITVKPLNDIYPDSRRNDCDFPIVNSRLACDHSLMPVRRYCHTKAPDRLCQLRLRLIGFGSGLCGIACAQVV
ncbi:hypothetical protein PQR68_20810 [Paraburkholderia agricolaris]|uniref:hypothetical protein n=1 Tax=Paraburkholderia agricolaris TaxID=2152888 RepID=UPI001290C2B7|nr:hypothetical protein [Paraburkholderia agricolaris]